MSQTPDARTTGLATAADIADVLMLAHELRETNNRRLSDALWRVGRSADHWLAASGQGDRAECVRCGHPLFNHALGRCYGEAFNGDGEEDNCQCREFVPAETLTHSAQ